MADPVPQNHPDCDEQKGAVEDDSPHPCGERPVPHGSLSGQIGHRDNNPLEEGADTDYPEPGSSPEHSGQHS